MYLQVKILVGCNLCWPEINQRSKWVKDSFEHSPLDVTGLMIESGKRVHLKRQELHSESLPLSLSCLLPLMSPFFNLNSFPHLTSLCSSLLYMTHPPNASSSPKPLQQISKPFCIWSLSFKRCPFRKMGGREDHPLIVRKKNKDEVQSYESKAAQIRLSYKVSYSKAKVEGLCAELFCMKDVLGLFNNRSPRNVHNNNLISHITLFFFFLCVAQDQSYSEQHITKPFQPLCTGSAPEFLTTLAALWTSDTSSCSKLI